MEGRSGMTHVWLTVSGGNHGGHRGQHQGALQGVLCFMESEVVRTGGGDKKCIDFLTFDKNYNANNNGFLISVHL